MMQRWNRGILAILAVTSAWLVGCAGEEARSQESGEVKISLAATASNGVAYGLEGSFVARGPEDRVAELSHLDPAFQLELISGQYEVTLRDFRLYRIEDGQAIEEPRAKLLSRNPRELFVPRNGLAELIYTFAVPGGRVVFDTGEVTVDLVVVEGFPDGSECLEDWDCASGLCLGGLCEPNDAEALSAKLSCELPLNFGQADVSLSLNITPQKIWTPNGTVPVSFQANVVFSEQLGQVMLELGAQTMNLSHVAIDLQATGSSENPIPLRAGPVSLELDSDGDGIVDELAFDLWLTSGQLGNDGSPFVSFTVRHVELVFDDFPVLGRAMVSENGFISDAPCELSSHTLSLPVEPIIEDLPGGASCTGDAQCASYLCLDGICEARDPSLADAKLVCELPLGMGTPEVDLSLRVAPAADWTPNSSVEVAFDAAIDFSADLVQVLLGLGASELEISSIEAEVQLAGGSPSRITLSQGPSSFVLDPDGDQTAEAITVVIPVDPMLVTNDGSESFEFDISAFDLVLNVPILGEVVMGGNQESSFFDCRLRSHAASFAVQSNDDDTTCSLPLPSASEPCVECQPLPPPSLDAKVDCELPFTLGRATVDVSVNLGPTAPLVPGTPVQVDLEANAVIPESLGQVLLSLGTDEIKIDSILAEVSVGGGTPSPVSVSLGAVSIDVDADDDGVAEDVTILIPVDPATLIAECAPAVDFSVEHFEVALSGIPLLGALVVSEDGALSDIPCTLSSGTTSFPTSNP